MSCEELAGHLLDDGVLVPEALAKRTLGVCSKNGAGAMQAEVGEDM